MLRQPISFENKMKPLLSILLTIILIILFTACSSSEETVKTDQDEQPEIYIFDDVSDEIDTSAITEVEQPAVTSDPRSTKYYVQVGAFTTRDRADEFVKLKSPRTTYQLNITYSEEVKLYVVRIPAFSTRAEAEKVRNDFWQSGLFNDAFIVTQ